MDFILTYLCGAVIAMSMFLLHSYLLNVEFLKLLGYNIPVRTQCFNVGHVYFKAYVAFFGTQYRII